MCVTVWRTDLFICRKCRRTSATSVTVSHVGLRRATLNGVKKIRIMVFKTLEWFGHDTLLIYFQITKVCASVETLHKRFKWPSLNIYGEVVKISRMSTCTLKILEIFWEIHQAVLRKCFMLVRVSVSRDRTTPRMGKVQEFRSYFFSKCFILVGVVVHLGCIPRTLWRWWWLDPESVSGMLGARQEYALHMKPFRTWVTSSSVTANPGQGCGGSGVYPGKAGYQLEMHPWCERFRIWVTASSVSTLSWLWLWWIWGLFYEHRTWETTERKSSGFQYPLLQ